MEKMGTLKKNGDQKTNFGPHGNQSPQMGTNMGAVPRLSEKWTNLPTVRLTNKGALDKKKRQ